jgi:DNA polymerase III epsilon subunit-like protein
MTRTYTKAHPGAYGLAIDWETTGSNFGGDSTKDYQGISFGAIIFDTETLEPVEDLYCLLQFDDTKYKWSNEAERIHGLTREHLAQHGMPRDEALANLLDLILRYIGSDSKVMFLGHNVAFDVDFTHQLCRDFGMELKVHHVMLETSGTAFLLIGKYKSDDVFEFFTGKTREGSHNALDDAHMALETARNMKLIMSTALEA